jgi:hypothetical protein
MFQLKRFAGAATAALLLFGFAACTVEQEEEGNLPEYEIEQTEEGNLPEYDVDAADVEIGTEEKTITVPDIDIHMPDEDPDAEDAAEEAEDAEDAEPNP